MYNKSKNNKYNIYLKSQSFFESPYIFFGLNINNKKNPEVFNKIEINNIKNKLIKEPYNLFLLESYIVYFYNKGDLDLEKYFKRYISIENNNPYILLRYARYQASSLYKLYNKNKKYLLLALQNTKKAINILEKLHIDNEIPPFIYSWFGFIYMELGKYNNAILLFEKTIFLNNNHRHLQAEPFLWKAIALNKLGKYKESNKLYFEIIKRTNKNLINNKLDFRVYKIISINYYKIQDYKKFYKNLKITIEKFLQVFNFNFNNSLKLTQNNSTFIFKNKIEQNKYSSFLDYNEKYIFNEIDKIILSIAYLYKENLLGHNYVFNDSRGIEKLCFSYLKLIYE